MPTLSGCMKCSALLVALGVAFFDFHGALAESATGPLLCAARDIDVITLIEDHGAASDVASARLAQAGLTQMRARAACSEGRVTEAIALYDEIIRSLGPTLARTTR